MPVRYSNKSIALRGDKIITNIIDTAYSGEAQYFNIVADGITYKTNGDARDLWKPMNLSSVVLNMYLDTPGLFTFYDEISEAEEGRFFLEIRRINANEDEYREFVGMILTDGLQRQDTTYPVFKMDAIDGLAILKEIPFEWSGTNFWKPLWEIFYDALVKNPVIQEIYSDNDVIAYFISKLEPFTDLWTGDLFTCVHHSDFFFEMSESQRTNWDCYRVIEELCNKYMLRITYDDGVYSIIGTELLYLGTSALDVTRSVTKGKTYGGVVDLQFPYFDVTNLGLDGGTYNAIKGYRQVRIEASKEGSNKYLAQDGVYNLINYDAGYYTVPPMIKGTEFELQIQINTTLLWQISNPEYGRVNRIQHVLELWVKFIDQETNNVFYGEIFGANIVDGDKEFTFKYVNTEKKNLFFMGQETWGSYSKVLKLLFPSYEKDRKVQIKYNFAFYQNYNPIDIGDNLREYDFNMKFSMGASPLGEAGSAIPINAYIENTKNTGIYNKKIYSSEMYGRIGTRAIFSNGNGIDYPLESLWRIGSTGPYEGLEKAMSKFMIKQLVNSAKLLKIPIESTPVAFILGLLKAFGNFAYKGKEYIITQVEHNYLDDVMILNGIEKKAESTETITSNSIVINRPPIESQAASIGSTSSMISRVNTSWIVERVEIGASGVTEINVPVSMYLPQDAVMTSVYNSLLVMIDGVMWSVVQGFNPADRRPRVMVDLANSKLLFNRTLQNTIVTLVYQNNIIKNPEYEVI